MDTFDEKDIADFMERSGYRHGDDMTNFTDSYCEAIEALYTIESMVLNELEERKEKINADDE